MINFISLKPFYGTVLIFITDIRKKMLYHSIIKKNLLENSYLFIVDFKVFYLCVIPVAPYFTVSRKFVSHGLSWPILSPTT